MGSVQFEIVPCFCLHFFSRSIGPFQCLVNTNDRVLICCICCFQSGSLFIILAYSVCKSFQCLIFTLTQGGEGGHLFRLTCSAVLWGRKNTAKKKKSLACVGSAHSVWITLGLPPITACVLSQSTLLRLQVALQGNCPKRALGFMHFPGLSRSGSGSQVLHKGTDSVGPVFCALPRSEELRRPGAW